ncbi:MarR family transcriptional regulator [Oceanobacillus piezotolerans]|uniref:MarR family transcriptional regulator n=1 Tax=Oceanobacillus piezotolerans TaxID=2448030 RepID=A0A498DBP8_9BACI|nr:MarR family winged helix-turn-helix transcriptional regulator [Oceanobacillus piezotolerans]RLL45460.1 MarR family transcriptional regulator [Oceanobacillus piezotolerans]
MDSEWRDLDLIDLLSERHLYLRRIAEKKWNDNSNIYLANSEWFILARVYKKQPTIAHVAKQVDISRQATHKFIKQLQAKGLVEVFNVENNKKHKYLRLTKFGEECYEKNMSLKAELENKIMEHIGEDNVKKIKSVLQMDWGI